MLSRLPRFRLLALVAVLVAWAGCDVPSVLVHRPTNPAVDHAISARWAREIRRVGQDGDWILSRSYFLIADGIGTAVPGVTLSHAALYSAEKGTVIETVETGMRETSIEKFVERNHYVILVRPSGMTDAQRTQSVEFARTQLGGGFDGMGMFGMDDPDTYYCSELLWWASEAEQRFGRPVVITPAALLDYGEVVYWSGERDNEQMEQIAEGEVEAANAIEIADPIPAAPPTKKTAATTSR